MQGYDNLGDVEKSTLGKYFNFLLFNVQFVFLLCSNAWASSSNIFLNPVGWSEAISVSIPSGSSFFMKYLILNLVLLPVELLRPGPLLYYIISRMFLSTPREYYELGLSTSPLNYGINPKLTKAFIFPLQILLFCVVLCYSIITPLILIPGLVYFACAWVVLKNQLLHVYVKQIELHGQLWQMAYLRTAIGLAVFQFITAGLLSVKHGMVQLI